MTDSNTLLDTYFTALAAIASIGITPADHLIDRRAERWVLATSEACGLADIRPQNERRVVLADRLDAAPRWDEVREVHRYDAVVVMRGWDPDNGSTVYVFDARREVPLEARAMATRLRRALAAQSRTP